VTEPAISVLQKQSELVQYKHFVLVKIYLYEMESSLKPSSYLSFILGQSLP
jgi:hypothetical protein